MQQFIYSSHPLTKLISSIEIIQNTMGVCVLLCHRTIVSILLHNAAQYLPI